MRGDVGIAFQRQVQLELLGAGLFAGAFGDRQAGLAPRQGGDLLALLVGPYQGWPADAAGTQGGLTQGKSRRLGGSGRGGR